MNKAAFHSAGRVDIDMFVNRFRVQRFVFLADGVDFNITDFTWQLFIKTNPGDLRNIISLTLGNGLSFPIYEENVIEARFESATTNIQEGDYYWQLLRTDTNEPWLNGIAKFSFGSLDSGGSSQEATINLLDNTISVELQSIVYVDGAGGSTRVQSATSTATLTPNVDDYDMAVLTAQAEALTIAAPTGMPTQGQAFVFRIKDNGTARALTFNAIYRAIGSALPTTTTISKTLYFVAVYNSTDTKWDVFPSNLEV